MERDANRKWRLVWVAAGMVGIVVAAMAGFYIGQRSVPPAAPAQQVTAPPARVETTHTTEPPVSTGPIDRASLLAAVAAAADATASGGPLPAENAELAGRAFTLRLPFGCDGPLPEAGNIWAGWTYNPGTKALKLIVHPERWDTGNWVHQLAGDTAFEAVEGFWIRRPWTVSEACPVGGDAGASSDTTEASVRQTVALAQFFRPETPRNLRRGKRPYAFTIRQEAEAVPGDFRLRINGRIVAFADGQPIHCRNEVPAERPICVINVEFTQVAFEDAQAKTLTEWR
ncbi:hypothetical protein [Edaphosphingomonas haloaromaticamans]|uniref:Uncharacterized protein n=1 Tax=Edaphosphingomonas haloaromaticamans TaxID=653954 RepID=A0A1S1HHA9_9SPHN|nr:hypothetical protein [Sphingomonas haloaromaticamans]OHT21679.1 hypothetical protein BHE75_03690 [Sphingomonas haloaromaticamans]